MKTKRDIRPLRNILLSAFGVIMVVTLISCAQKFTFLESTIFPEAEGYVRVKKDSEKNYVIKVIISHLPKANKVQSAKSSYVVWIETDEGNYENLGQLESSTGFLSKINAASLKTVSPFRPIKIFITTENAINAQYTSEQIVLTTDNNLTVK